MYFSTESTGKQGILTVYGFHEKFYEYFTSCTTSYENTKSLQMKQLLNEIEILWS